MNTTSIVAGAIGFIAAVIGAIGYLTKYGTDSKKAHLWTGLAFIAGAISIVGFSVATVRTVVKNDREDLRIHKMQLRDYQTKYSLHRLAEPRKNIVYVATIDSGKHWYAFDKHAAAVGDATDFLTREEIEVAPLVHFRPKKDLRGIKLADAEMDWYEDVFLDGWQDTSWIDYKEKDTILFAINPLAIKQKTMEESYKKAVILDRKTGQVIGLRAKCPTFNILPGDALDTYIKKHGMIKLSDQKGLRLLEAAGYVDLR